MTNDDPTDDEAVEDAKEEYVTGDTTIAELEAQLEAAMSNGDGDDQAGDQDGDQAELLARDDGLATRQEFQMRFALAQALGENLPIGDKDYYEVFNWDKHPTVEDYYALALRNPYAYAVTFLEPDIIWRDPPTIRDRNGRDGEDVKTEFEAAVQAIIDEHRVNHYLRRGHKLAGIGKFGCVVIEFDDIDRPENLNLPVGNPGGIRGLRPFSRASITDVRVGAPGTTRWNEPTRYKLDFSDENETEGVVQREGPETVWVHHERVIHIPSDELLDDEVRGIERQKPVYNNLIDIERALGAAGTLAYRAAAWGIHINIDKDFELEDGGDTLREHLQRWRWGLDDVLRTHGADDVKSLGGENINPKPIIDANIEAISAQRRIPQSVLKGNETGERATTQDLKNWYGDLSGDRHEFVTPLIVREFWDRLIQFGVIPEPRGDGYDVEWEPFAEMNAKDEAEVQERRSKTVQNLPDLEMELTAAEQARFVEDGKLPNDLDDRINERDAVQDEMGALDDGHDADTAEPGDDVVDIGDAEADD